VKHCHQCFERKEEENTRKKKGKGIEKAHNFNWDHVEGPGG